jgi:hypothetical protein
MKPLKYQTAEEKKEIHTEAMKRWNDATAAEDESRRLSTNDKIFNYANGGQWVDEWTNSDTNSTGTTNSDGTVDRRPRFEINLGSPVISRMVGEQRRTDIGPEIRPEGQNADKNTAETRQGLIRNIEKTSNARNAYDNAYTETLVGGYGGFEVVTRFVDDDVFDQEIAIQQIVDATSSLYFGPSREYDKSDAPYAFKAFDMDKDVFEATYPDAEVTDFSSDNINNSGYDPDWFSENTIRLAVYWRKKSIKKTIVQLSDGQIFNKADIKDVLDEMAEAGLEIVNERQVDSFKLEKFLVSGAEVLEMNLDYKGRFIPLIPVFGEQINVGGAQITHGKVRFSKDAARILNYLISSSVEKVALGPGAKILVTPEQIAGHTTQWEQMNVSNDPTLQWNALDENGDLSPAPAPRYLDPPQVNQMEALLINDMKTNIYATMGTSGQTVSDGTAIDPRSGEAIKQAAVTQETGSYLYQDNLHKSIEHCYVVINDLLGHTYDTARQVRIIKPDDTSEMVFVNTEVIDTETGEKVLMNDLSSGKFGVSIKTGAAFDTQRQEAADNLIRLTENDPELRALGNDIIVGNLDGPGMDEFSRRLKENKIKTGQLVPTPEEAEEMGINRDQLVIQNATPQIQQQIMQDAGFRQTEATTNALNAKADLDRMQGEARVLDAQAKLVKAQGEAEKTRSEVDNTDMDTVKKSTEALQNYANVLSKYANELGIPLTLIEHDNRVQLEDLVELSSFVLDPDLNSAQRIDAVQGLEQRIGQRPVI